MADLDAASASESLAASFSFALAVGFLAASLAASCLADGFLGPGLAESFSLAAGFLAACLAACFAAGPLSESFASSAATAIWPASKAAASPASSRGTSSNWHTVS